MKRHDSQAGFAPEDLLAETAWVRALARSLMRDPVRGDDVAQDALVVALERGPDVASEPGALRRWLAAVVRRKARHAGRGEARRARRQALAAREREDADADDLVLRHELQRRVSDEVARLREPYRSTILRHHLDGWSVARIAEHTDSTAEAVRQRLARGRRQLRERLEAEWGDAFRSRLAVIVGRERDVRWRTPVGLTAAGLALLAAGWLGRRDPAPEGPVLYADAPDFEPPARDRLRLAGIGMWSPPEDGAQATLAEELGLRLSDVEVLADGPAEDARKRLAERHGVDARTLLEAELFTGRAQRPGTEEEVAVRIARLPLPAVSDEARVVLAVESGHPMGVGLWGTPALDEDPDMRWGLFAQQLLLVAGRAAIGADAPTPAEQERALRALADEEPLWDAYLLQRRAMSANMMLRRAARLLGRSDRTPPASWYTDLAERMRELAASSAALEPVLGSGVEHHAETARAAAAAYERLAEIAEAGDTERFAERDAELRASCKACHDATLADGTTAWFDAFDPFVEGRGLPTGMLRIGRDLAPAPGDDGALSQQLADALRAGLVLLDSIE